MDWRGREGWELGTPAAKQQESSRWVTLRPGKWGHRDENQERNTRNNSVEGQRGTREEHKLHAWMTEMIMSSAETGEVSGAGWGGDSLQVRWEGFDEEGRRQGGRRHQCFTCLPGGGGGYRPLENTVLEPLLFFPWCLGKALLVWIAKQECRQPFPETFPLRADC